AGMCGISLIIDGLQQVRGLRTIPKQREPQLDAPADCPGRTKEELAQQQLPPPTCSRTQQQKQADGRLDDGVPRFSPINLDALKASIGNRGPDCTTTLHSSNNTTTGGGGGVSMTARGSVLSLRRSHHELVAQPLVAEGSCGALSPSCTSSASSSSWLLWNGEVFGGHTVLVPEDMCDTTCVLAKLHEGELAASASVSSTSLGLTHNMAVEEFLRYARLVLEGIHGPYAVIYHAATLGIVVFGRDPVGRRSLLVHRSSSASTAAAEPWPTSEGQPDILREQWIISSVAAPHVGVEGLHNDNNSGNVSTSPAQPTSPAPPSSAAATPSQKFVSSSAFDYVHTGTEYGCWWEVPTGGLYALCVDGGREDAGRKGSRSGEEVPTAVQAAGSTFLHIPWEHSATYGTHPVLREECRGAETTELTASSSEVDALLEDIVHRVGYALKLPGIPTVGGAPTRATSSDDSSPESSWMYLKALAHAVWIRVAAHTTGVSQQQQQPTATHAPPPPMGLLFSGGIDSTILAALAHYLLPVDVPIELINVAFGEFPEQTPDRIGCVLAMHELLGLPQPQQQQPPTTRRQREWRLVLVDASAEDARAAQAHVLDLIYPRTSVMDLNIGTALWFASRGIGKVLTMATPSDSIGVADQSLLHNNGNGVQSGFVHNKHLRIARSSENATTTTTTPATNGDLREGHESPKRPRDDANHHSFQALIDVLVQEGFDGNGNDGGRVLLSTLGKEYGETLTPAWRALGYKKLGQYLNDASCAGVVYFGGGATSKYVSLKREDDIERAKARVAAGRVASLFPFLVEKAPQLQEQRGEEDCGSSGSAASLIALPTYQATSRVLLLGMGADESLGGYMRYRRTFEREGLPGLTSEMQRDFSRLWTRNLGRDDRVVADHGREGRFPFLAEEVFHALTVIVNMKNDGDTSTTATDADVQLSRLSEVVDVSLAEGVGDKKLLRTCARMLGLRDVSKLQKRAIQFGTRIADRKLQGNAPLQHALQGAKRPRETQE
ncbi:asparagine synthase, putative, partial [Bodo saltans]